MTRRAVQRTQFLALLLSLACLLLFALVAVYLFGRGFVEGGSRVLFELRRYWKVMETSQPAWAVLIAGGACLIGSAGSLWLRTLSGGKRRRELFFFRIFLASLGLCVLRPLLPALLHAGVSMYGGLAVTKLAYLGEFFGVFALFAQSFYAFNGAFRREGTVLSVMAFTVVFLAYSLSVDVTELHPDLLFRIGREDYLSAAMLIFSLLTVGNYIRTTAVPRMAMVSVVLMTAGFNLLFAGLPMPLGLVGLTALTAGSVLFMLGCRAKTSSE
jgi:hypothetical protein